MALLPTQPTSNACTPWEVWHRPLPAPRGVKRCSCPILRIIIFIRGSRGHFVEGMGDEGDEPKWIQKIQGDGYRLSIAAITSSSAHGTAGRATLSFPSPRPH